MTEALFFHNAPKAANANLKWRSRIRKAALNDPELQATIRQACFNDPLFFIAFAAWLIEPRSESKIIPFCLWQHQIPAILALVKSINDASANSEEPIDVVFDKSRAQGATWICLYVLLWFWLKEPMFAAGIISRSIEAVDKKNYPGSLFPKLDWALSMLPWWLLPHGFNPSKDRSHSDHVWHNRENGAVIVGTACTAEAFSGDRLTVVFYDEAAKVDQDDFQDGMNSIQHVTLVRWVVSTHYGDSGPFYEMIFGDAVGVKVVLDWRENPSQNRLAYSFVNGKAYPLKIEDADELREYIEDNAAQLDKLKRRGFIKDGRTRSPWYDRKCLQKGATPRGIAQDLDRDPRSTVGKLFNPDVLDKMVEKQVKPPVWQGDVVVKDGKLHLARQADGPLKLWFMPGMDDKHPVGRYVIGGDIGTGLSGGDSSNSALEIGDSTTGEQVGEYVNQIPEARLAHVAVALAEWLDNAYLIWEAQGSTGKRFGDCVVKEIGYANIYRRERENVRTRQKVETYGWVNNQERHKVDLFEDFWLGMDDGEFIPRSAEMILECRGWERDKNEKIVYHGTGHGDRAIAGGLCRKGMKEMREIGIDKQVTTSQTSKYGTFAWRRDRRRGENEFLEREDDMTGFDVAGRLGVSLGS